MITTDKRCIVKLEIVTTVDSFDAMLASVNAPCTKISIICLISSCVLCLHLTCYTSYVCIGFLVCYII